MFSRYDCDVDHDDTMMCFNQTMPDRQGNAKLQHVIVIKTGYISYVDSLFYLEKPWNHVVLLIKCVVNRIIKKSQLIFSTNEIAVGDPN